MVKLQSFMCENGENYKQIRVFNGKVSWKSNEISHTLVAPCAIRTANGRYQKNMGSIANQLHMGT